MNHKEYALKIMSSLSSGAKKISEMVTPPMETEEILGKFIDQELPKYLNGGGVKSFSRYYRMLCISPRECILRLNGREVWHIPSEARTYQSKNELAWAIMKGEASPIISPNGKEIYLFRDNLRHHAITIDEGTWIVSYEDWSGMTQKEHYASMPEVILHQHSRDYLHKKCKDGWKGVGRLAFPDEKIVCHVTPAGFIEKTCNPFGDGGWTITGTNCLNAPYWIWEGDQAAVADTNTISFYSADGVLMNEIIFDSALLGIAKSHWSPGAIVAITREAVIKIEASKTGWHQVCLHKNPLVLEDGTTFAVDNNGLRQVIEPNEKGELELVDCATTVGLPGKIEKIFVYRRALAVKCEGIDEQFAFYC